MGSEWKDEWSEDWRERDGDLGGLVGLRNGGTGTGPSPPYPHPIPDIPQPHTSSTLGGRGVRLEGVGLGQGGCRSKPNPGAGLLNPWPAYSLTYTFPHHRWWWKG